MPFRIILENDLPAWGNGANIFVSILVIMASCVIIYFLYKLVYKEFVIIKNEKFSYIEGVLNKNEILANINTYISKLSYDTPFAVVYVDVDQYDELVNAFGDAVTKQVMQTIANKTLKVFSFHADLGRLSNERFLILLKGDYNRTEVLTLINELRNQVKEPVALNDTTELNITCSYSIAFYPKHGQNSKQLCESLEIASYIAKRDGGDKIVVYSEEMGQAEGENVEYYMQVKRGIANKEFLLYYQPIVDLKDGHIRSIEALLRWDHPEFGVIPPNKFINILEQSGDIYWVGLWGLETMIDTYNQIKQRFSYLDIIISMNLSPKQLMSDKLAIDIQKILKKNKMLAKDLVIEIEEFIIFEQHDTIKRNILRLKELGFRIAVDGFALDHNILMKIQEFPIDIIKLDSQKAMEESEYLQFRFTQLLVDYAKEKDIMLVQERIEDKNDVHDALKQGIDLGQGYFFSRPIEKDALINYIANDEENALRVVDIDKVPIVEPEEITSSTYPEIKDSDESSITSDETVEETSEPPVTPEVDKDDKEIK